MCRISQQDFSIVRTSFTIMKSKDEAKKAKEDKFKKELGLHLRGLRLSKKLTLRQLDAITGVDYSSIKRTENGSRNTPAQDLVEFAKAFEIDMNELVPLEKF